MLFFFFFNDTAPTEIYTLSLHDALPISCGLVLSLPRSRPLPRGRAGARPRAVRCRRRPREDRKSTRLNSSHTVISYAVFCLKKKNKSINKTGRETHNTATHAHTYQYDGI